MKSGDVKMAATLFVLLGEETAAGGLKHLYGGEIEGVTSGIFSAGPIPPEDAEKTAEELYGVLMANRYVSDGGMDYAKKVILRTLGGSQARRVLDRLSSTVVATTAFEAMDRLSPMQLSQFI